jgi:ATP-dependent DNA helicase DinG
VISVVDLPTGARNENPDSVGGCASTPSSHSLARLLGPEGGYAQVFPNYEQREEQIQMALAVADALAGPHHLLVEAGTGVGKSLAYLTPAAIWATASGRKVLISTCTKVLQNQLIKKDIPLLQQVLGPRVKAEPVFGQENYLCLRRLNSTISHGLFDTPTQGQQIEAITHWAETSNGVLVDYPASIDYSTLNKIGRNSDNCQYNKCPFRADCHYFKARDRWQMADLLVANHYLYFANAAVDDRLLPYFEAVVFDEAHRLEAVCAEAYGIDASRAGLDHLLNSVHHPRYRRGIIVHAGFEPHTCREIDALLDECRRQAEAFFTAVGLMIPPGATRCRVRKAGLAENLIAAPLASLGQALKQLVQEADDADIAGEILSLQKSAQRRHDEIDAILSCADPNAVYWIEAAGPNRIHLRSALIDVADRFRAEVFEKHPTVVLTSATLTVSRDFRFIVERIGAGAARTLLVDSPFNFAAQSMLFVDGSLPSPAQVSAFVPAAARRIKEILSLSRGRALVLFTSYDMLEQVHELLPEDRYRIFRQGEASTFQLLESFKEDVSSVLLATQSFWEGIDVPGEALSCLVIARLPFEVPDDPRLEGIAENLHAQGREPFTEYQLPQAVLRFRQGFGRLIRNKTDRGVVCLLDGRIAQRAYGRAFFNSLPKGVPVTRDLKAIRSFFRE